MALDFAAKAPMQTVIDALSFYQRIRIVYSPSAAEMGIESLTVFLAAAFFPGPFAGASAAFLATILFAEACFTAAFLGAADLDLAAAFFAAHRFFKAATMFALPALLRFRFAFGASCVAGVGGSDSPLILAHLAFCPSAIRRRAAAETLRFPVGAFGVVAVSAGPPASIARSSAI
jgi:hypothetical protein